MNNPDNPRGLGVVARFVGSEYGNGLNVVNEQVINRRLALGETLDLVLATDYTALLNEVAELRAGQEAAWRKAGEQWDWMTERKRADTAQARLCALYDAAAPFATFNSSEPTITVRTPDITRLRAALQNAKPPADERPCNSRGERQWP